MVKQDLFETPEVTRFLGCFNVTANPLSDTEKFLESLRQLDPRYKGDRSLVRYQLEADTTAWFLETQQIIMATAEAMGMLKKETPLKDDWDFVIVLGGARQAPLDRLRYAIHSITFNEALVGMMTIVGSARKLLPEEQNAVKNYAPNAKTEFDLCTAAAKTVYRESPSIWVGQWFVNDEQASSTRAICTVIHDVILQDMTHMPYIAAVTTQIYTCATEFDLARVAREYGIKKTFVAGNPSDPELVARRTTATYLSEVLRTLRAAAMYFAAIGGK